MAYVSTTLIKKLSELSKPEQRFIESMIEEWQNAVKKHPSNALKLAAVGEEHGEVCKAILDEPWSNVYKECAQLASTSMRLATEGDSTVVTERLNRDLDCPF